MIENDKKCFKNVENWQRILLFKIIENLVKKSVKSTKKSMKNQQKILKIGGEFVPKKKLKSHRKLDKKFNENKWTWSKKKEKNKKNHEIMLI